MGKVDYLACFQTLKDASRGETSYADYPLLAKLIERKTGVKMTPFKVARCMDVFSESHLVKLGVLSTLRICFRFLKTEGKTDLAKRAKAANLDAIHDTVHEMARDEARHGKAFAGLLKRYFG